MKNLGLMILIVLLSIATFSTGQVPPPVWEFPVESYQFPIECQTIQVANVTVTYCYYIIPYSIPPVVVITSYGTEPYVPEEDEWLWEIIRQQVINQVSAIHGNYICQHNPGQFIEEAFTEHISCYAFPLDVPFWGAKRLCPGTNNKCTHHYCYECDQNGTLIWIGYRGVSELTTNQCWNQMYGCRSDCPNIWPTYNPNLPCE